MTTTTQTTSSSNAPKEVSSIETVSTGPSIQALTTQNPVNQPRPSSTTEIVHTIPINNGMQSMMNQLQTNNSQLASIGNSMASSPIAESGGEIIPLPKGQTYIDITEYLNMPQSEAAKKLGIPPSTLSKRWKEAVRKRKWPFRMVCKIDKEIMTLLHNVPQGPNAPPLPEEIEGALGQLLRKRQEELRPVVIRI